MKNELSGNMQQTQQNLRKNIDKTEKPNIGGKVPITEGKIQITVWALPPVNKILLMHNKEIGFGETTISIKKHEFCLIKNREEVIKKLMELSIENPEYIIKINDADIPINDIFSYFNSPLMVEKIETEICQEAEKFI